MNLYSVYVIDDIPVKSCNVNISQFSHLKDLPVVRNMSNVDLLIGQDNSEILIPLQVRKGKRGEPFAVQTLFGWSVNGPSIVNEPASSHVVTHFISTSVIEQQVRSLWNIENEGLCTDMSMSPNDEKVIQFWNENIHRSEGHYVLPIPFKENVLIPNNFDVADCRLKSLKKSLLKRGLFDRYGDEMVKMIEKGYAEKVPIDAVDRKEKVWYLPHHGVISDKKPGKLRIVFDCASKFLGESLNDKCLQGPDLNNKLLNILLRFRQHQFAITADVEAMYYQVRVEEDDRDVLRFLWYD